ncbi:MAG: HAD family hydrolase [Patescibacteria group bacterium]
MQYKAVIFDVDGTILPVEKTVLPSLRLKQVIKRVKKQKIAVGLATARQYKKVAKIVEYLELDAPLILSNGGQIADPKTAQYLVEHTIPEEHLLKLMEIIREQGLPFWIQDNGHDYISEPLTGEYVPYKPFVLIVDGFKTSNQAEEFIASLPAYEDISVVKSSAPDSDIIQVHITHILATKQHGIENVGKLLEINQSEIIGIGDGYNDIPLFKGAGLKVAMGNAVEALKKRADYIAPSVTQDGVSTVMEKFLLN